MSQILFTTDNDVGVELENSSRTGSITSFIREYFSYNGMKLQLDINLKFSSKKLKHSPTAIFVILPSVGGVWYL